MSEISRRKLITTGLAVAAGATGLAVVGKLAARHGLIPPDSSGIYGPGETLTYAAQRLLTRHSMAREFSPGEISKNPFANEVAPLDEEFNRLQAAGFVDWKITVDGMAARPTAFSLAEIKAFPTSSHADHDWFAKKDGRTLRNGRECHFPIFSSESERCHKSGMLSIARFSLTGGRASTWLMHCIHKL